MAVAAATKTFMHAVKPVGECIEIIHTAPTAGTGPAQNIVTQSAIYDFFIDQNYIVTGLEATKIVAASGAAQLQNVVISKVANDNTTETPIGQASFAAAVAIGTKAIAGVASGATIGAATVSAVTNVTSFLAASTLADPVLKVAANVTPIVSPGTSTLQRIRVRVMIKDTAGAAADDNSSCFITVRLARYNASELLGQSQTALTTIDEVIQVNN